MSAPSITGTYIAGSLAIAALLAGCGSGGDAGGPNPAPLAIAKASPSGDNQAGAPGQGLTAPLRIAAARGGTPEAGIMVTWTASGTGSLAPTSVLRTAGGNRFDPNAVTIGTGGTVTWIWGDGIHNVTSSGSPSFQSSGAPNGPPRQYSATFNAPGQYNYVCTVHPGMNGRVTVQ